MVGYVRVWLALGSQSGSEAFLEGSDGSPGRGHWYASDPIQNCLRTAFPIPVNPWK